MKQRTTPLEAFYLGQLPVLQDIKAMNDPDMKPFLRFMGWANCRDVGLNIEKLPPIYSLFAIGIILSDKAARHLCCNRALLELIPRKWSSRT